MTIRVVVCDDDPGRVGDWAGQIQAVLDGADVVAMRPEDFASAVKCLKNRRAGVGDGDNSAAELDSADVLVLDSDLTPDRDTQYPEHYETLIRTDLNNLLGAEVAHLARCFSDAGAIVVVNDGTQQRTFDLTMADRMFGVADVYVSEEDVDNRGLWSPRRDVNTEFRPWSWPRLDLLPSVISYATARVELDSPWLEAVGLSADDVKESLLVGQLESLEVADADEALQMTFRQLAQHGRLGIRRKEWTGDQHLRRIAASAARRWIDRVLLPSQNLLVDLPHLLQERPWLLPGRDSESAWMDISGLWSDAPASIEEEAHNAVASSWIGRNVWSASRLAERPSGARALATDPVFCEDTADFRAIEEARDFLSDIEGSYSRRFVADLEDVEYMPRNRLAR